MNVKKIPLGFHPFKLILEFNNHEEAQQFLCILEKERFENKGFPIVYNMITKIIDSFLLNERYLIDE